jgi:DNA repair exonuclease SbcCD nuclease subunit
MSFRFVHAADIHLDSPLLCLDEYAGAPVEEIRLATRKALARLVDFTIESESDFLIIAGDLFDGEWRDCNTALYFISEMKRLREAGINAYIALGNHDAGNRNLLSLPWPDHVRFFDFKKSQRIEVPSHDVLLHGQSFRERHIEEDMTSAWPVGSAGAFNIGILRTSASDTSGHERYAPCSVDSLRSRHYQYWALGHVHTRKELAREPWVVFPGNIQGRNVRECGPRGCYLVNVDDRGSVSLAFEPLDVVRWDVLDAPLSGDIAWDPEGLAQNAIDQAAAATAGRSLAVRIRFTGYGRAWNRAAADLPGLRDRIRMAAQDASVPVHVEKLEVAPASERKMEELEAGPIAELRAMVREFETDESLKAELAAEFEELKMRVQGVVLEGEGGVNPQDAGLLRGAMASVEALLEGAGK